MLVCFIGFFQLEQLGTSECILTYSLETTDCVSNRFKIQKMKYLSSKIKLLIPKRKSSDQIALSHIVKDYDLIVY